MSGEHTIVLVGIGGYGSVYLADLLRTPPEAAAQRFRLVGLVDPDPSRCESLGEIEQRALPLFATLEDFYRSHRAELAIISSPIHCHAPQTCLALSCGSHVLCEKPVAATVQEVDTMMAAERSTQRRVAVGYQWSFAPGIQQLKSDIRAGHFGRPLRLKSLCLWPRPLAYYQRNTWAGRQRDATGSWILDSPLQNAMAHDLHNMLYVLGQKTDSSARPLRLTAELYRANAIETFDTAAVRVEVEPRAELLFFASHAVAESFGPVFDFEFSDAVISYAGGESPIVARFRNGLTRSYESPSHPPQTRKLWTCLEALEGKGAIPCGLRAARSHTLCVNGAHESVLHPRVIPSSLYHEAPHEGSRLLWVDGLAKILERSFHDAALPSELDVPWAQGGRTVDLRS
ncbi:MAG: Gfo/Idh/MocA family oxidoreductase [Planctomycetota bacterium]